MNPYVKECGSPSRYFLVCVTPRHCAGRMVLFRRKACAVGEHGELSGSVKAGRLIPRYNICVSCFAATTRSGASVFRLVWSLLVFTSTVMGRVCSLACLSHTEYQLKYSGHLSDVASIDNFSRIIGKNRTIGEFAKQGKLKIASTVISYVFYRSGPS